MSKVKILGLLLLINTQVAISSPLDDKYDRYDACVNSCELTQIKCLEVLKESPNDLVRCERPYACLEKCEERYMPSN